MRPGAGLGFLSFGEGAVEGSEFHMGSRIAAAKSAITPNKMRIDEKVPSKPSHARRRTGRDRGVVDVGKRRQCATD